ncbi:MAG TPA: Ig-like domain-containing protein [Terriglobales bacterium]|nr:Ig-like domain-containing protein [Terriglobales bacterium]
MHRFGRKLAVLALFAFLTIGSGCTGFFVKPTLTSLAIGPQDQTITVQQTLQMSASGTYSDGSQQDLTGKVNWSSDTTSCATVSSTGLVTPVKSVSGVCKTTISAASGTVSAASTTVTVSEGTPTLINLTVTPNTTPNPGDTLTFQAMATFPGVSGQQDITSSVTWVVSDTTNMPLVQGSGQVTVPPSATAEQVTVQATFDGVPSNQIAINIQ